MDQLTPKERLSRSLKRAPTDRAPVICPGGMMNSAVVDIMEETGRRLPEAHHDWRLMTALAEDVQSRTGFENFGLPFCMTIEPEALGSEIDFGSLKCEPKIVKEAFGSAAAFQGAPKGAAAKSPRGEAVLMSLAALAKKHPDVPAVGSLTGPVSTAASLVEPMIFLKQLRKDREAAHAVLAHVAEQLIDFAVLMADNGAAAVCINDPTATGEILGPKMFEEYAVFYLNRVVEAVQKLGVPVIVHICGDIRTVVKPLAALKSEATSFDAMVNLEKFKAENPHFAVMGNLSTYLLEFGDPERVRRAAELLIRQNIDLKAPACGLSTSTPLANIQAFTETVRQS
ncbi:MAG: methylcobamide--CoM methyltransferase [Deltaproteobacteria bacterium]|nr:methylcobamide--CoM methyltransferase [Deltaproteobacteria bacterium]